jgi:hypothetical protein
VEKKKFILFILLISVFSIFNLAKNGKAYYTYIWYFTTDRDTYYNDETIHINASWDLDYNPSFEISYVRIMIFDESDKLLWNSSIYDQIGTHLEGRWDIRIQDLDLPFNNTSNTLLIRFFYYFYSQSLIAEYFVETIEIQAIKRNITCELIDFQPHLNYEEFLDFKARFYSLENNSNLINHIITVKIISENSLRYNKNFTTNASGIIEISIPSSENLTIGKNYLIFELNSNKYFDNVIFIYEFSYNTLPGDESDSRESHSELKNENKIIFLSNISMLSISFLVLISLKYTILKTQKNSHLRRTKS